MHQAHHPCEVRQQICLLRQTSEDGVADQHQREHVLHRGGQPQLVLAAYLALLLVRLNAAGWRHFLPSCAVLRGMHTGEHPLMPQHAQGSGVP